MSKTIDLIELRRQLHEGIFKVFVSKGAIYIKDTENDECIELGRLGQWINQR